jgi:hypothetical protein
LGGADCADGCRRRAVACTARALAQLGPLLCLYPGNDVHPLTGWGRARYSRYCAGIDSEGPRESLLFFDELDAACWQLCLLPDTDFLIWDQLASALPQRDLGMRPRRHCAAGAGAVARSIGEPLWRACPLKLHAVASPTDAGRLAAAGVALSAAGLRQANWLARSAMLGEPPLQAPLASVPTVSQAGVSSR